ncbi:hypothetical protein SS50377_20952 [Spironucleus salmonicida]|uniref:Uncharacterized protein n=1 Tax=Spironucleus salmonicida TaxID=348837 RepID=A0A9P8M0C6_9EUKA|nr:hypothetical protein SS50377_20952 [Spironucleus salmonicida]
MELNYEQDLLLFAELDFTNQVNFISFYPQKFVFDNLDEIQFMNTIRKDIKGIIHCSSSVIEQELLLNLQQDDYTLFTTLSYNENVHCCYAVTYLPDFMSKQLSKPICLLYVTKNYDKLLRYGDSISFSLIQLNLACKFLSVHYYRQNAFDYFFYLMEYLKKCSQTQGCVQQIQNKAIGIYRNHLGLFMNKIPVLLQFSDDLFVRNILSDNIFYTINISRDKNSSIYQRLQDGVDAILDPQSLFAQRSLFEIIEKEFLNFLEFQLSIIYKFYAQPIFLLEDCDKNIQNYSQSTVNDNQNIIYFGDFAYQKEILDQEFLINYNINIQNYKQSLNYQLQYINFENYSSNQENMLFQNDQILVKYPLDSKLFNNLQLCQLFPYINQFKVQNNDTQLLLKLLLIKQLLSPKILKPLITCCLIGVSLIVCSDSKSFLDKFGDVFSYFIPSKTRIHCHFTESEPQFILSSSIQLPKNPKTVTIFINFEYQKAQFYGYSQSCKFADAFCQIKNDISPNIFYFQLDILFYNLYIDSFNSQVKRQETERQIVLNIANLSTKLNFQVYRKLWVYDKLNLTENELNLNHQ